MVSRKLQAMRTMLYPGLQIELHRVALTLDQVRHYNLPSTPLKETETRKSRWRQVMQHEQTKSTHWRHCARMIYARSRLLRSRRSSTSLSQPAVARRPKTGL